MTIQCFIQVLVTAISNSIYKSPNFMIIGQIDNSGIEISYTLTPPKHEAATLAVGTTTVPALIIPPNADNFTVYALCSSTCLDRVRIFVCCAMIHNYLYSFCQTMGSMYLPLYCTLILLVS